MRTLNVAQEHITIDCEKFPYSMRTQANPKIKLIAHFPELLLLFRIEIHVCSHWEKATQNKTHFM